MVSVMNLIEELRNKKDFSSSEKSAALFIADHIDLCLKTSVDKLGEMTYTSGSTISRVIKKLGFGSFSDFKIALAKCEEAGVHKTDFNIPFEKKDSFELLCSKMRGLYIDSVSHAIENIDRQSLLSAARLISSARELAVYGKGPSYYVGEDFSEKLRRIGIKTSCFASPNEMWTHTFTQDDRDVALFVSFYGRSEKYLKLCRLLKEKKIGIITVTGIEGNRLSKEGTVNICCSSREQYGKIGAFESRTEMQFVLDLLFCELFQLNYDYNLLKIKENLMGLISIRGEVE